MRNIAASREPNAVLMHAPVIPTNVLYRVEQEESEEIQYLSFPTIFKHSGSFNLANMERISCSLCGAEDSRLVFTRKDFTYRISEDEFCVVRCRQCGLVYVNPRPTEGEIQNYYTEDFYSTTIAADELLRQKERQLLLKYRYVQDLQPGKLLDIGCSKGEFLLYMQQKGWEVYGSDFSTKPPNLFGLDIFYGDLDNADYTPQSFDLVTLWAVFEHVYYPRRILAQANRFLKPGGRIVLLVTNFNSFPARLMRHDDIPRHTTLFTKRTLSEMLRRTGFVPISFDFDCELFGGSNRGVTNYLVKLAAGERIQDIVAQNRSPGRWDEFSGQLRGKTSQFMSKIDRIDITLSPSLDRLMDRLGWGFIMIAVATKK
jgi:SAM-dependent methyltransferase